MSWPSGESRRRRRRNTRLESDVAPSQRRSRQEARLNARTPGGAASGLEPSLVQAVLELRPAVVGALNQNQNERHGPRSLQLRKAGALGVEMIRGDVPDLVHVLAQHAMVATGWAESEFAKRLCVAERGRDGLSSFLFTVPWHEHMFASTPDGTHDPSSTRRC